MNNLHMLLDEMVKVWQSMRIAWDITRQSWHDKDRNTFEREHIYELSRVTEAYISQLSHLAEELQKIRNATP